MQLQLPEPIIEFIALVLDKLQPFLAYLNSHAISRYALITASLSLLVVMLLIYLPGKPRKNQNLPMQPLGHKVIEGIAGDNLYATQLDLARAYIETNQKALAKRMLDNVMKQGNKTQQDEARQLTRSL